MPHHPHLLQQNWAFWQRPLLGSTPVPHMVPAGVSMSGGVLVPGEAPGEGSGVGLGAGGSVGLPAFPQQAPPTHLGQLQCLAFLPQLPARLQHCLGFWHTPMPTRPLPQYWMGWAPLQDGDWPAQGHSGGEVCYNMAGNPTPTVLARGACVPNAMCTHFCTSESREYSVSSRSAAQTCRQKTHELFSSARPYPSTGP